MEIHFTWWYSVKIIFLPKICTMYHPNNVSFCPICMYFSWCPFMLSKNHFYCFWRNVKSNPTTMRSNSQMICNIEYNKTTTRTVIQMIILCYFSSECIFFYDMWPERNKRDIHHPLYCKIHIIPECVAHYYQMQRDWENKNNWW